MSLLESPSSVPSSAFREDEHGDAVPVRGFDASSQRAGWQPPRVDAAAASTDTVEGLLLSIARGNHEAFVALQSRTAGLVRANVRRVLRDASRSEAVTRETFAEVLADAIHFDPYRDTAQTWLLTRAHQRALDALGSVDSTDDPQGSTIAQPALGLLPNVGAAGSNASSRTRLEGSLHPS